jgi:hypothetical protein
MDAFCSELMGITMGTLVAEGLPYHVTLYSDCMAAIARGTAALAPGARAKGHLRNGPNCDVLCQQSQVMHRLLKWIKAHPEKRKKKAEFTYEDWGSFLADAAAEGKWQLIKGILPQVLIYTVILEDIMDEILPLGSWHWRDDSGKLVMSGIKERVMRLRGDNPVLFYG